MFLEQQSALLPAPPRTAAAAASARPGSTKSNRRSRTAAAAGHDEKVVAQVSEMRPKFEVQALMGRKIGIDGEPHYLVRWKGFTPHDDSWEPWGPLASCIAGIRAFHEGQFRNGSAPLGYAPGCPSGVEPWQKDRELHGWRITSKRTPSGREYRVYYGPLGEHVRSRNVALQLAALYELPDYVGRIPSPMPINGAPTANGHANAPAAVAGIDPAGAAASAFAIAQTVAAAKARAEAVANGEPVPPTIAPVPAPNLAPASAARASDPKAKSSRTAKVQQQAQAAAAAQAAAQALSLIHI